MPQSINNNNTLLDQTGSNENENNMLDHSDEGKFNY